MRKVFLSLIFIIFLLTLHGVLATVAGETVVGTINQSDYTPAYNASVTLHSTALNGTITGCNCSSVAVDYSSNGGTYSASADNLEADQNCAILINQGDLCAAYIDPSKDYVWITIDGSTVIDYSTGNPDPQGNGSSSPTIAWNSYTKILSTYYGVNAILASPAAPADSTAPNVTLISPTNNTQLNYPTINFTFNVSDESDIENCSLILNNLINQTTTDINKSLTNNISIDLGIGFYNWSVNCTDSSENTGSSEVYNLSITDNTAPAWTELPQNQIVQYGSIFSYDVNASDDFAILTYFVNDTDFAISNSGLITNATGLDLGIYYLNISVNDTLNNINSTVITITVQDNVAPTWNETPTNQIVNIGAEFNYNVNASDNYAIDSYFIDDTANFSIDSVGLITNATGLSAGIYWLNISVNDTSNNILSQLINISIQDAVAPTWNETPTNQIVNYGDSFSYDVNASDNTALDSYFIDDTTNFSISSSGLITNATGLDLGIYWINISVNDTSNNILSQLINITVQDNVYPTWNETPTNRIVDYGATFNYNINASDNYALDSYYIDDASNFTISGTGIITNATSLSVGVYWLNISVNDTSNNILSQLINITIQDNVYPTWNETPTNQITEYGTLFSYDVNASDNYLIDSYSVNDTNFAISDSGLITNSTGLDLGIYYLNISVNDTSNNILSQIITITIQDTTAPTWNETPTNQIVNIGAEFSYDVNASDNYAIDSYYVDDTANFSISSSGLITNATGLSAGVYWLNISVNDTSNNILSQLINISIQDIIKPEVSTIQPISADEDVAVNYNATVSDNDALASCNLYINGTLDGSMTISGGVANRTATFTEPGTYTLLANCTDSTGNYNDTSTTTITINDLTIPTWDETPASQTAEYGTPFSYDVNASDNGVIDSYFINDTANFIVDSNGVITNATGLDLGIYYLNISVNDTSNNILSQIITITIQDTTAPTWNEQPTNQIIEFGDFFSYDVNASDNYAIDSYSVNDTNFAISDSGLITNATGLSVGIYWLNISVNDTSNNILSAIISLAVQDTTPPEVSTIQPTTADEDVAINYNATISDLVGVINCNLYIDSVLDGAMTISGSVANRTVTINTPNTYQFLANCTDAANNFNDTSITTITINDVTTPTWNETPTSQTAEYGTLFSYNVNASDNYLIDSYSVNDTNFAISDSGLITNATGLDLGIYYLNISVNDTSNNILSQIIAITIQDTTAPTWNETPTNQTAEYGTLFNYDVNASDISGISSYFIDDTTNFTISGSGVITNATGLTIGNYSLNISVNDTSNNILSQIITISITAIDMSAPVISSLTATVTNESATITWTTDDLSNSSVQYSITGGSVLTSGSDGDVISHSITITGLQNFTLYYYNVTSCNIYSNCSTSSTNNFTTQQNVEPTEEPEVKKPSRKSISSGIIFMPCSEDWTCTDWSACSEDLQTRTCTDNANCGTELFRPEETQSCEAAVRLPVLSAPSFEGIEVSLKPILIIIFILMAIAIIIIASISLKREHEEVIPKIIPEVKPSPPEEFIKKPVEEPEVKEQPPKETIQPKITLSSTEALAKMEELKKYIEYELDQGFSKDHIRKRLIEKGWPDSIINDLLNTYKETSTELTQEEIDRRLSEIL